MLVEYYDDFLLYKDLLKWISIFILINLFSRKKCLFENVWVDLGIFLLY